MSSDARKRAEEALRRVLANAAAIVRLSWSDGATAADCANMERIKSAAADIAQDHKILRALLASEPAKGACADCGGCGGLGWIPAGDEQLGCIDCNGKGTIEPAPPAGAEVARLTALLRECNAVCLCGCPDSEHESYGEDGESCGHDDHECIRVAPAVLAYVNKLRSARALPPEVEAAAEDVVRGDWWGHYCPSCGSTFKHGPECRIGRLAKALSSARAAKGGAE